MPKLRPSLFRKKIESHFDDLDLDMIVRRRKQGYAVYWLDDDEPLAQFRPTGHGEEVEVFCWGDARWEPVREFGLVLPLAEALTYVTDDPEGVFFDDSPDNDEGDAWDEEAPDFFFPDEARKAAAGIFQHLLVCALFGAAVGGACESVPWAIGASLLAGSGGCLCLMIQAWLANKDHPKLSLVILAGLLSCLGGITGSAAHAGLGSGFWPAAAGLVIGALCNVVVFLGSLPAWLVGLFAGLNLAAYLIATWHIGERYSGLLLAAVFAAGLASFTCGTMRFVSTAWRLARTGAAPIRSIIG
jgi:hypothetical protein